MKRKKFVKKLMSMGYSRNEANAIAAEARRCGITYDMRLCVLCLERAARATEQIVGSFFAFAEACGKWFQEKFAKETEYGAECDSL